MYHAFFFTAGTPDQALRLVIRNRVSLANTLPISYRDRIRKVPGVRAVSVYQYCGGVYKDARDLKLIFDTTRPQRAQPQGFAFLEMT